MSSRGIHAVLAAALLLAAPAPPPARACDPQTAAWGEVVEAIATPLDMLDSLELTSDGPGARTERTVEVKPGSSLELSNFSGDIVVRTGSGNRVRVVASHSTREHVTVRMEGLKLIIECDSDRMVPASVHYEISVPAWMDLDLSGVNSDITIEGVKGEVKAETVQGDIALARASGPAMLSTVQGEVRVEKSRGRVEASAINGSVRIEGADGAIVAESVNGDILLSDVSSDSVDASTVNGPVRFAGRIQAHGLYRLASHNGSIRMAVPEGADARVLVSTFRGGFESSFPVKAREKKKGREYVIQLGSGGAVVNLESFQGRVLLYRPGEPEPGESDHERELGKDSEEDSEDDE
jgi:hypothetical protein